MIIKITNQELIIDDTVALDLDEHIFHRLARMVKPIPTLKLEHTQTQTLLFSNGILIAIDPMSHLENTLYELLRDWDIEVEIIDTRGELLC